MEDEDYFMNDDDLAAETQISLADKEKIKILENMKKKIDEAIENLEYSEKTEYISNFSIISRYVSAIIRIESLESDTDIAEEELLEEIEKIEITVKELSFQDLRDIEKSNEEFESKSTNDDENEDNNGDISNDFDF